MPRYYFDLIEDDLASVDQVGLEFPDLEAAKVEALRILSEIEDDSRGSLAVEIRSGPPPDAALLATVQIVPG